MQVKITVAMGRRTVPLEEVTDPRISGALRQAGRDVATKLAVARCPEHGRGPSNVRLHLDAKGAMDLNYDSCCEKLGQRVGEILGG